MPALRNGMINAGHMDVALMQSLESRVLLAAEFSNIVAWGSKDSDYGNALATDAARDVYAAGSFSREVNVNPLVKAKYLDSIGNLDAFLVKYDMRGRMLWARSFGGDLNETVNYIATDAKGNVYLTGIFGRTVDFNPIGHHTYLSSAGEGDIYVAKYSASGEFQWARSVGGSFADTPGGLAVTPAGDVYFGGLFVLNARLTPTGGTIKALGTADVFIEKLDTKGNFKWYRTYGADPDTPGYVRLGGLATQPNGDVIASGSFADTIDFDPGAGVKLLGADAQSAFVTRLNGQGKLVWAESYANGSIATPADVAVDSAGNIYTTGQFQNAGDFNPGAGTAVLDSVSDKGGDVFVEKFSSSGKFAWVRQFGGRSATILPTAITLDSAGNPYVTGAFAGTIDFRMNQATHYYMTAGGDTNTNFPIGAFNGGNAYIVKLSTAGAFGVARQLGGYNGAVVAEDITLDANGNIYTTGAFSGDADFRPGPQLAVRSADDPGDFFLSKLLA